MYCFLLYTNTIYLWCHSCSQQWGYEILGWVCNTPRDNSIVLNGRRISICIQCHGKDKARIAYSIILAYICLNKSKVGNTLLLVKVRSGRASWKIVSRESTISAAKHYDRMLCSGFRSDERFYNCLRASASQIAIYT